MTRLSGLVFAVAASLCAAPLAAQEVMITPDMAAKQVTIKGETLTITRNQDPNNRIPEDFTKTSRACPPFCVHPIEAAPGVATLGELEVMDFLDQKVATGRGLLVDSRVPEWFAKGTIPGAINVPFATLEDSNPYRDQILEALGARKSGASWDFSGAMELALFCNGAWCDQSPRSIRNLIAAGYPASKLSYYRGGMQSWVTLGLTVKQP